MPLLGVYSWSQFTTPPSLPVGDLRGDSHANDPASPIYEATAPTWIGETFTFNGGAATQIDISDDDGSFEDGYVETGGAQTLTQEMTIDGVVFPAGSVVENEFSLIDAGGQQVYVVRINGENVGFAYRNGEEPVAGESFTAQQGLDGAPVDNTDGTSTSSDPYAEIICFAAGTLIETDAGPRPVEHLRVGNRVLTLDHGFRPVRWLRSRHQCLNAVAYEDRPFLISADALSPGRPNRDLVVSPQHRIFVGHGQLSAYFDCEALVPAKSLTRLRGVRHMRSKSAIQWVHFACDVHQVVYANGCLAQSLLLGPMVVNGLDPRELDAVRRIFGSTAPTPCALNGPMARGAITVRAARAAIERGTGAGQNRKAKIGAQVARPHSRNGIGRVVHAVCTNDPALIP